MNQTFSTLLDEQRKSPSTRLIVAVAVLLELVLVACGSAQPPTTESPSTLLPARAIVDTTLPLHEIWRENLVMNLGLGSAVTPSFQSLAVTQEAVYVVEYHPVNETPLKPWRMVALDATTGRRMWETEQLEHIRSLAVSPISLFVATSGGIKAYNVADGRLRWVSDQPPPEHEDHLIFFEESQLKLITVGSYGHRFLTIDPESGLVANPVERDGLIAVNSEYQYLWSGKVFWSEDRATNTVKWEMLLPSRSIPWPIGSGSILILPTVTSNAGWHSVVVVDRGSGRKVWECLNCYASDVAVDKDALYAILSDGSLAGYDLNTGQLRGTLQFSGGGVMEPLNMQYSIAAVNGRVFIYFEDSQELIAVAP